MRDLSAYIKACWSTALAIRERQKAMMGLVAAFLALPLILALGGKLELTVTGAYWAAVWLTTSAFLHVLIVAPFLIWREDQRGLSVLPKMGSLAYKSMESGIEIEPDGSNRLNVIVTLSNLTDELLSYTSQTEMTVNGVTVARYQSDGNNYVSGNQPASLIFTGHNVPVRHVNAMVGHLDIDVNYSLRYRFAKSSATGGSRTTGKLITVTAPIHLTGKNASTQLFPRFKSETEA